MCTVSTLYSMEQINDPYTRVLSPLLGTVLDTGDTVAYKTKVVRVLGELPCQWDGVDMTTLGARTLYLDQREGRWHNEKNRIDSEESLKRQTWKHIFCSGFLITKSRSFIICGSETPRDS